MLTVPVRPLAEADRAAVERLLAAHPIAAAQVAERISARGLGWRADGRLFGFGADRHHLESLLWCSGQITPVAATSAAVAAFADLISGEPRTCASLVGPSTEVLELWRRLEPHWGPARAVRAEQPLLATDTPSAVTPDPLVRRVLPGEVDQLFPAAVAMYTEEVGVSPLGPDRGRGYRNRVADLIRAGRSYARFADGKVIFKAELAIVTAHTTQVQGVWVDPQWRGRGIATTALAAVVRHALDHVAPSVSLYVNAYNTAALKVYRRLGMRQVGEFATVLF